MKKRGIGEKSHLKKKSGLIRVRSSHGSTRQINRVLLDCCTRRPFVLSEPVQPPGPGLTRQAGPNLITLLIYLMCTRVENPSSPILVNVQVSSHVNSL